MLFCINKSKPDDILFFDLWSHYCQHHPLFPASQYVHDTGTMFNITLQWCHNERDGISNRRHFDCLHGHLFSRRSKKTPQFRFTGLFEGNPSVTGGFPHNGTVTRKMFPFDGVILGSTVFAAAKEWDMPSPGSNPDSPLPVKTMVGISRTINNLPIPFHVNIDVHILNEILGQKHFISIK